MTSFGLDIAICHNIVVAARQNLREPPAVEVRTIGTDLTTHVFQVHGVDTTGQVIIYFSGLGVLGLLRALYVHRKFVTIHLLSVDALTYKNSEPKLRRRAQSTKNNNEPSR